jgi:hypothetical protein
LSTPSSGLLFEVAPEERDGQTKKKPTKKPRKAAEDQHVSTASEWVPDDRPFLASIDGHHQCERCGMTVLDLADVRKVDGKVQWLLQCGWGCLAMQFVDPIPGILEKIDEEETKKDVFQVRGGRFDGQTFDEIEAGGHRWYIEQLVKAGKRTHLAEAAARWLTKNR